MDEALDPPPDSVVTLYDVVPLTRWSWKPVTLKFSVWNDHPIPRVFLKAIQSAIHYQQTINARSPNQEFAKQMGVPVHPYRIKGMITE